MTLKKLIPFIILFALIGLLYRALFYSKPNELPSALLGESLPAFHLPNLYESQRVFSSKEMQGHVSLLNIWATWCYACRLEHPTLMKIKEKYHVPIYSIVYKDDVDDAKMWLNKQGNPYSIVGNDSNGDVAIDLGVYGTPETYIISPKGTILYRHVGMLNQKTWEEVLYPIVRKYEKGG